MGKKFMAGRYGGDALGSFTLALYLLLYVVGAVLGWWLLRLLALGMAGLTIYRMLSRDIGRRREENQRFLALAAPVRNWWRTCRMRCTDKEHKYFKCPHCGQQLRVPRGSGKIRVTCRNCNTSFEENS